MKLGRYMFVLVALVIAGYFYVETPLDDPTGMVFGEFLPSEKVAQPMIYFCPQDNCTGILVSLIESHDDIKCALFDLDLPVIIDALEEKQAYVFVDADNDDAKGLITNLRFDTKSSYSHNKFCVFDGEIVLTGSFNPTYNGAYKNNNNVFVFQSSYISQNYLEEFIELWEGSAAQPVSFQRVMLNGHMYENYFCPDDCKDALGRMISLIDNAQRSIYFMTFSFTHDDIGDALLRAAQRGVYIQGVFEKSQSSKYSEFSKLNDSGLDVVFDTNPRNMHHKVFIIDKEIVVTGSANPSNNGFTRNDENILIVHDPDIALDYLAEFRRVQKHRN